MHMITFNIKPVVGNTRTNTTHKHEVVCINLLCHRICSKSDKCDRDWTRIHITNSHFVYKVVRVSENHFFFSFAFTAITMITACIEFSKTNISHT